MRCVVVCAFLAVLVLLGEAWAGGSFIVVCGYSHSRADDPIIFPRSPGASHMHDFIGAKDTNAFSTLASMLAGGTACKLAADTAGAWTPALYRNGVQVDPTGTGPDGHKVRTQIYYNRSNLASDSQVQIPPPDLRIVAGNGHAMSEADNPKLGKEIYWGCSDNSVGGKPKAPPPSCPTGIISLHVGFPNCWDGVLTGTNDTEHLRYPSGGACPDTHPIALPRVILRWEYPVGYETGDIMLSSGPPYTAHGDFWQTWDQNVLTWLVNGCINRGVSCGKL